MISNKEVVNFHCVLLQNSGDNDCMCHLYTLRFLMYLTLAPEAFKENMADLQGHVNRFSFEQHKTHVLLRSLWSLHLFLYVSPNES